MRKVAKIKLKHSTLYQLKILLVGVVCIMGAGLLSCGKAPREETLQNRMFTEEINAQEAITIIPEEEVPLAGGQVALIPAFVPVASGTQTKSGGGAVIDYSNTGCGYVMVKYAGGGGRIKVQVKGPVTTYTYDLAADGTWDTYPLTDGNGGYNVTVYQNVVDNKYAAVTSASFGVTLADEFAPFIRPNQYVDYQVAPASVALAGQLTAGMQDPLQMVAVIYDYVVGNLTYDTQKAATVQSGYLPVLDVVLAQRKGICFDYASLMTGMLRSQGVPCKLVVGYAGNAYHAWINVYTPDAGWIDGAIYFNGSTWQRMDPTFASSGKKSAKVMQYIGNGNNYISKYIY